MRVLPELVLTLGIDASGKTSFSNKIAHELGYVVLEPTSSELAKAFKVQHLNDPVTVELVRERRNLFRKLNTTFDATVRKELQEHRVITTGHRLVTEISHAVMDKLVGGEDYSVERIIEGWQADEPLVPDEILFTHAPIDTIRDRLQARLTSGDTTERMAGFNSLYFLGQYQQALGIAVEFLAQEIPVQSGDTSMISVAAGFNEFIS